MSAWPAVAEVVVDPVEVSPEPEPAPEPAPVVVESAPAVVEPTPAAVPAWSPSWTEPAPEPEAPRPSWEEPAPWAARVPAPASGDATAEWLPPWSPGVERAILAAPTDWAKSWSPPPEEAPAPLPYVPAPPKPRSVWASVQPPEEGDATPTPIAGQPAIPPWTTDDGEPWTAPWTTGPHATLSEPGRWQYDEP